jgi:hypothetical protein
VHIASLKILSEECIAAEIFILRQVIAGDAVPEAHCHGSLPTSKCLACSYLLD